MYWEAQDVDAAASRGTTRPAFLRCIAVDSPTEKCSILLVKSGISDDQYASEYVANKMAQAVGIPTPPPSIVNLSESFIEEAKAHPDWTKMRLFPGLAVGSHKLNGLSELAMPLLLTGEERTQGQRLFALDVIGQQSDRQPDNPNAGKWKGQLIAFDFQLEFQLGWQDLLAPDELFETVVKANRMNPFRSTIGPDTDLEAILHPFNQLNKVWFEGVAKELPEPWKGHCMAIGAHVEVRLSDRDTLVKTMREASRGSI